MCHCYTFRRSIVLLDLFYHLVFRHATDSRHKTGELFLTLTDMQTSQVRGFIVKNNYRLQPDQIRRTFALDWVAVGLENRLGQDDYHLE